MSEIGFGGYPIGGPFDLDGHPHGWVQLDKQASHNVIAAALDSGINFFDTADIYGLGSGEELLGEALAAARNRCVLATKVGNVRGPDGSWQKVFSADHIRISAEHSLRRLKTDRIDLYQLHNPSLQVIREGDVFAALEQLKKEGKIRFYGVSVSHRHEAEHLLKHRLVDTIQLVFNVLHQEASVALFGLAKMNGVGLIVREPLESGLLTGKYRPDSKFDKDDVRSNFPADHLTRVTRKVEAVKPVAAASGTTLPIYALRYCLSYAEVSTVIVGTRSAEQVRENASASERGPLSEGELRNLQRLWRRDFGLTTPAYRFARRIYRFCRRGL